MDWEAVRNPMLEHTGAKIPSDPGSNRKIAMMANLRYRENMFLFFRTGSGKVFRKQKG